MSGSISRKIGLIIAIVLTVALVIVFWAMLMNSENTMIHSAENNVKDVNKIGRAHV